MGKKVLYSTNFYFDFFEKGTYPNIYTSISYKVDRIPIYSIKSAEYDLKDIGTLIVKLFPSYLHHQTDSLYAFNLKKIFRVKGYCIRIDNITNIEEYLNSNFKPNFRTSMRRRYKGLVSCFDISFKMFYGKIGKDQYELLMNELHTMLIRRFNQRNDVHMSLANWKNYYTRSFELINEKKASLYVIYDGDKPIQISLSYHRENILFLSIPSYNIDYAKFGLGNIAVQKLLEWCLENDYKMLDMGFGAFDYKLRWCNHIYDFDHHLFYRKSSSISQMIVQVMSLMTLVVNYLIAKRINIYYNRFKKFIFGSKTSDLLEFTIESVDQNSYLVHQYQKIEPFTNERYAYLRKAIYDFIYTKLEHISQIEIYELEEDKSYIIKGTKQIQKITYNI